MHVCVCVCGRTVAGSGDCTGTSLVEVVTNNGALKHRRISNRHSCLHVCFLHLPHNPHRSLLFSSSMLAIIYRPWAFKANNKFSELNSNYTFITYGLLEGSAYGFRCGDVCVSRFSHIRRQWLTILIALCPLGLIGNV